MEWLILLSLVGCAISSVCAAYISWASVKESKVVDANYGIYLRDIERLRKAVKERDKEIQDLAQRLETGETTTGLLVTADRLYALSKFEEEAWVEQVKGRRDAKIAWARYKAKEESK